MTTETKKVVLITGASSGIGMKTAIWLLNEGHIVYGAARRVEKMAELKDAGISAIKLDVTDDTTMVEAVKRIIKEQGRIDVLVNNAGYGFFGALEDVPISEARRQFEVNVFGLGRMTQIVLPHMRKQGSGKIINVSSTGGIITTPFGGWYQSSKFAMEGLSDTLRKDVKRFGIDVVVIEPGAIESEWASIAMDHLLKISSEPYREAAKKTSKAVEDAYKNASDPSVIARIIFKAINAKKPKTRYVAGKQGKMILMMHSLLTDRQFDKMILKRIG
jgi:NAD(P)-dependent dehydrogenase (short-subunit alcohol dehydrogenase family)